MQKIKKLFCVVDWEKNVNYSPFSEIIFQNGLNLSGGERQKVAIARALYLEREIIIMDEATNALDHKTEEIIINNIVSTFKGSTIILRSRFPNK